MELLALLGLLGFGVYYATSSKSSSDNTVNPKVGPFSDVNCNVIFNGLPKEQKDVVLQAVVAGNKDNIKVAANAARLLYPDMAKCLDALVPPVGEVKTDTTKPINCDVALKSVPEPIKSNVAAAIVAATSSNNKAALKTLAGTLGSYPDVQKCVNDLADAMGTT